MVDAVDANKQTDENIDKLVGKIMNDYGSRRAGNALFDDIEKCFYVANKHYEVNMGLEVHIVDKNELLRDLQADIL
jgi:hypothetical protein